VDGSFWVRLDEDGAPLTLTFMPPEDHHGVGRQTVEATGGSVSMSVLLPACTPVDLQVLGTRREPVEEYGWIQESKASGVGPMTIASSSPGFHPGGIGSFCFEVGPSDLRVTAKGYRSATIHFDPKSGNRPIVVQLEALPVLRGQVASTSGMPIARALVQLAPASGLGQVLPPWKGKEITSIYTGVDGRFTLAASEPGPHAVGVSGVDLAPRISGIVLLQHEESSYMRIEVDEH